MDPLVQAVLRVLLEFLEERERLATQARKDLLDQPANLERLDYLELKVEMVDQVLQAQKVPRETRVTQGQMAPLDHQEMMGNMETVAHWDQRVKKESQEIKADLDPEAHQELKDQKEILELLVSPAPLVSRDQEELRESLVILENTERKVTAEYRVILDLPDNLVFKDPLENLECLVHLANKAMLDNLE